MIYSDSRGQSEELHFIIEKRKMCNHSTAEQERAGNRLGGGGGGEKKKKKIHTKQSCMVAVLDHMTISYENTM